MRVASNSADLLPQTTARASVEHSGSIFHMYYPQGKRAITGTMGEQTRPLHSSQHSRDKIQFGFTVHQSKTSVTGRMTVSAAPTSRRPRKDSGLSGEGSMRAGYLNAPDGRLACTLEKPERRSTAINGERSERMREGRRERRRERKRQGRSWRM